MKRLLGSGTVAILALSSIAGCDRGVQSSTPADPPPTVTVTDVVSRRIPHTVELIATTEAVNSVTVRARVEGFLEDRLFTEGDLVAEGDLLYRIDPSQFEADLQAAKGDLATHQAALAKAQSELQRFEALLAKRDLSQETYDSAVAAEKEARAKVASSGAAVEQATLNLDYATITAPLDGHIGETRVDVGNLVGPDENSELATIVQLDPIHVSFRPGGEDIDAIAARHRQAPVRVTVTLADSGSPPRRGEIDFIDNQVDPTTGTLRMRALIPNPDNVLMPGRFSRVQVELGEADALLVPQRALVQNQGGFLAYVLDGDDRVQERRLEVGAVHSDLRVVESGLQAGERVVVDGVQQVKAGMTVKTNPATVSKAHATQPEPETSAAPPAPAADKIGETGSETGSDAGKPTADPGS